MGGPGPDPVGGFRAPAAPPVSSGPAGSVRSGRRVRRRLNTLHFGVCLGVDRYPGFPGLDLGSARLDATRFRDWLVAEDGGGLPDDNVELITATADETWPDFWSARPHARQLNAAIFRFNDRISRHLADHREDWPQTRVYLYAAGHGVGPPRGECGVLLADAHPQVLGNYIDVSKYRDWYLSCGLVREIVIVADCCREIVRGVPPANEVPFTTCELGSPSGAVAFTAYATRLGGLAWEPTGPAERDRARGYFTRALLDGLAGGAADRRGVVTSTGLGEYVAMSMAELTRGAPFVQEAEPRHLPGSAIVLAGERRRPLRRVTVRLGAGFEGQVVVRSARGVEHGPSPPGARLWTLELPDGYYEATAHEPPGDDAAARPAAAAAAPPVTPSHLFKVLGDDAEVAFPP